MGLTMTSTGTGAVDGGLLIEKKGPEDRVIALAGMKFLHNVRQWWIHL